MIEIIKDWSLVLFFAVVFGIIVYRTVKASPPASTSQSTPAASSAIPPAFPAQRSGNNNEIMAAISAAVNEYQKNNK